VLRGRARKEAREEGVSEERSQAKTLPITSTIAYARTTAQKVWSRGAPPLPTTAFQQSPIVSTWQEHQKDQGKTCVGTAQMRGAQVVKDVNYQPTARPPLRRSREVRHLPHRADAPGGRIDRPASEPAPARASER
jgi:hypothetical protein